MNDHDLLAKAADIEGAELVLNGWLKGNYTLDGMRWDPLTKDDQAMALVKKYKLEILPEDDDWHVVWDNEGYSPKAETDESLNRAIVMAIVASKES